MSQPDVEHLRKMFTLFNEGGAQAATDALGHLLAPDFALEEGEGLPDPETYTGRDAFIANLAKLEESFDELRMEPLEIVDLGERVVVVVSMRARGRGSSAPVEMTFTQLWSLRDGKAVSLQDFETKAQALEAAALSPLSIEVRAMAEALNAGDLEAFVARTAEDVEFTSLVAEAEGRTYRGHAGVRSWWETVLGAFQDPRWEVLDMHGSGDRAVAKSRLTATLADAEVEQTMWMAAGLRDGKVGWWGFFRTEREALEAAGLGAP